MQLGPDEAGAASTPQDLQILSPDCLQLPLRAPEFINIGLRKGERGPRFVQDADSLLRSQRRTEGKWLNRKKLRLALHLRTLLCAAENITKKTLKSSFTAPTMADSLTPLASSGNLTELPELCISARHRHVACLDPTHPNTLTHLTVALMVVLPADRSLARIAAGRSG